MGNFNTGRRPGGNRSFGRRDFGGRDDSRGFGRSGGDRQLFRAVCSNCGKDCEVPFRPNGSKPVYCSDCFENMGTRRQDLPRQQRADFRSAPIDQNKRLLEDIEAKLERIIELLETKAKPVETNKPEIFIPQVVAEAKTVKKVKKTTSKKKPKTSKK